MDTWITGKLRRLNQDIRDAYAAMADELELRATTALWKLAKRFPDHKVTFCSAMGTYDFDVKGDDVVLTERDTAIFDKVMLTFDEVVSEHGYRPIPAPLYLSIEHGKLERKTDW